MTQFNFNGIPVTIGYGEGEMPYVILPDLKTSLNRKLSVVDLKINFSGGLVIRLANQLLDPNGNVIEEAFKKPTDEPQTPEDFTYFFNLEIGNQTLGDSISKQLINGILETALGINCYSWDGSFLQPLSFQGVLDGDITITLVDHDNSIDKEYSFDGGATWQDSNVLPSPAAGEYQLIVRYKNRELRKGKSFKSIQETLITVE